ncbi:MAG: hypothetical protein JST19_01485 [Bacteroidetes bacterium]|nr:hypothetical protein [Bacteroidota bacterium]
MSELNEYECELLDVILEAFGVRDYLTRLQLMQLFDQDEASAFAMVQILLREQLIIETGKHGEYDLPDKIILKPRGEKFLREGGFSKRYRLAQEKPPEMGSAIVQLQQENLKLQNLRLSAESERNELKQTVDRLLMLQKICWVLVALAFIGGYLLGHLHHKH